MTDLADLLKRIDVGDDLLPAGSKIEKGHTLQRLKAVLVGLAEGPDTDEIEIAIRTLQATNGIRVGQQHSEAINKTQSSFDLLGIRYPVDDWDAAWSRLRSAAADAFLRLSHVVHRLEASGVVTPH